MKPSNNDEITNANTVPWPISAVVLAALSLAAPLAQAQSATEALELSGGASSLIVLGPLSGQASAAIDATVSVAVSSGFAWTAGARLGVGAWSSEVFSRFSAASRFGAFLPQAGVELGVSARGDDDRGEKLLSDGRAASRGDLSPFYIALHASPLRFKVFQHYRLNVLELQLGTHLAPLGRFVRLHVGLISLGVVL